MKIQCEWAAADYEAGLAGYSRLRKHWYGHLAPLDGKEEPQ